MQSVSASGCSDATTLMAARVFGPRPQELDATRPRVRARFNNPRNVARSCSGEGGSANIFPRLSAHSPQKAYRGLSPTPIGLHRAGRAGADHGREVDHPPADALPEHPLGPNQVLVGHVACLGYG